MRCCTFWVVHHQFLDTSSICCGKKLRVGFLGRTLRYSESFGLKDFENWWTRSCWKVKSASNGQMFTKIFHMRRITCFYRCFFQLLQIHAVAHIWVLLKPAFLQGKPQEREIFVELPNSEPGVLRNLKKLVYGSEKDEVVKSGLQDFCMNQRLLYWGKKNNAWDFLFLRKWYLLCWHKRVRKRVIRSLVCKGVHRLLYEDMPAPLHVVSEICNSMFPTAVFTTDEKLSRCHILSCFSIKIRRVVKSILAAAKTWFGLRMLYTGAIWACND